MSRLSCFMALAVMLVANEGYAQCTPSFQGLSALPGGSFESHANALSTDGVVVVGDRFGSVFITDESFSAVSGFTVGSSGIFVHIVP